MVKPRERLGGAVAPFDARDGALLAGLVALFLATRLLWLWLSPETACYWEESYRWMAMHELLHDRAHPLLDYQADHYQGGSLVMILLGLPGFALLGESLLVFKLPALLFSSATLAALYALGRRHFGRDVAVLSGLAYVAGPPLVAYWGMVVMGFHAETALFGLLQILCFLEITAGGRRDTAAHAAFGLACGLGIWFSYTAALPAAACVLTWMRVGPWPPPRGLLAAVAGLAAGLLPWLAYNATHDFAGIDRALEVFGLRASSDPWDDSSALAKGTALVLRDLFRGLLDPSDTLPPVAAGLVGVGYLLPLGAGLVLMLARCLPALWRGRNAGAAARREAVFPVYLVVFVVGYLASRYAVDHEAHPIGYRHLAPVAVLWIPPLAISAASGLARRGGARVSSLLGVAALLAASAAATFAFAAHSPARAKVSLERGDFVLGILAYRKTAADLEGALAMVRRIPDPDRRNGAMQGVGWGVEAHLERRGEARAVIEQLRALPPAERKPVLEGVLWAAKGQLPALEEEARATGNRVQRRRVSRIRALQRLAQRELGDLVGDPKPEKGSGTLSP